MQSNALVRREHELVRRVPLRRANEARQRAPVDLWLLLRPRV